jgi:tetratricopeptide (TPR) repeat protein
MAHTVETFADPSSLNQPVVLVVEDLAELIGQAVVEPKSDSQVSREAVEEVDEVEAAEIAPVEESTPEFVSPDPIQTEIMSETDTTPAVPEQAYEEFIADAPEVAVSITDEQTSKPMQANELKVEPDTKNAHVWNELGNVYFNTGAFEEAMTAYSKAIELDDWFAWPYSNLALVYVQKEKYAEAILLYQRSIELFSSDKDKAVTWNRLGNVYRRLNDYDNAIACYQRADDLDPNNATRSLRSRFSLLGSLSIEQAPSLAV